MKRVLLFTLSFVNVGFVNAQRGSRDEPNLFLEEQIIIGIQEAIEQSPSSTTFTFNNIEINPGYRVWYIKTMPIVPLKAEPTIDTVPPCLVNFKPPERIGELFLCHGRKTIFVYGVEVRGAQSEKPKTYQGLSLSLEGISVDQNEVFHFLQNRDPKLYILTTRTYHF